MSGTITFSGLASGMDTSAWIDALVSIKQQSVTKLETKQAGISSAKSSLSTVKTKVSSLQSAIAKFTDSKFGVSNDLFSKNKVTSSDSDTVSATVTGDAARQSFDIVVNQLATSTTATSTYSTLINEDTNFAKLAGGKATVGDVSIYVDGKKYTFSTSANPDADEDSDEYKEGATLGTIMERINAIDGVNASISDDGKFTITAENEGSSVVVGASTDDSNFSSVLNLKRQADGSYQSFNSVSSVNTSSKLSEIFGDNFVAGTFKIGGAEFTVDENTTVKSLIGTINGSTDAGTNASWDAARGKLVLTSKTEGAFNINIEGGTSNITNLFGFTTGDATPNEEGIFETKLKDQELGQYAELNINGTDVISSSNTVTSDISGYEGLTLELKKVSKEDEDSADGEKVKTNIAVAQDTDQVVDAVKEFITAYNNAISSISTNTASGASLHGESALSMLSSNLKNAVTTTVGDDSSTYNLLAQVGISTGKASTSTSTSTVNQLQLDEDKLREALQENPDAVKTLLLGDGKGESTSGGVFNKIETLVDNSLDLTNGFFATKNKSYETQISNYDTKITSAQLKVDSYKSILQKQFNSMETMISNLQSNYSNFTTS